MRNRKSHPESDLSVHVRLPVQVGAIKNRYHGCCCLPVGDLQRELIGAHQVAPYSLRALWVGFNPSDTPGNPFLLGIHLSPNYGGFPADGRIW